MSGTLLEIIVVLFDILRSFYSLLEFTCRVEYPIGRLVARRTTRVLSIAIEGALLAKIMAASEMNK